MLPRKLAFIHFRVTDWF